MSAQNLFPSSVNGKIGFKSDSGVWLIKPQFDGISANYRNNLFKVTKEEKLFLVGYKFKQLLIQVPNAREVKFLQNNYLGIQNVDGLWALCTRDKVNSPLDFKFKTIDNFSKLFIVREGDYLGIIDSNTSVVLPSAYTSINPVLDSFYLAQNEEKTEIFKIDNTSKPLLSYPKIRVLGSSSKPIFSCFNQKRVFFLNRQLDTINRLPMSYQYSVGDYVVFTTKTMYRVVDYYSGELLFTGYSPKNNLKKLSNSFLWLKKDSIIIGPNNFKKLPYETYKMLNNNKLTVSKNGKFGIINDNLDEIVECKYMYFNYVNDAFLSAYSLKEFSLIHLPSQREVIKGANNPKFLIKPNMILVTYFHGRAIYYSMDDNWNVEDQLTLYNNKTVVPISVVSSGNWGFGGWGGGANNVNVQLPSNWFRNFRNKKIGLKSPEGDTIIKEKFIRIRPFNDTFYWAIEPTTQVNLASIANGPRISLESKIGLINQFTGEYKIKPKYYFIDMSDMSDTSSQYARAISQNGYFYLIDKKTGKRKGNTASKMMLPRKNGLWAAYKDPSFYNMSMQGKKDGYHYFGPNRWLTELGRVLYGRKNPSSFKIAIKNMGANILDSSGSWVFQDSVANGISSFKDIGKVNIISIQDNKLGVLDREGVQLVEPIYSDIKRIGKNKDHFMLMLNETGKGIVDDKGTNIIPNVFYSIESLEHNRVFAYKGIYTSLLNDKGDVLNSWQKRSRTVAFSDGVGAIKLRGGYSLINIDGNVINEEKYKKVYPFLNGSGAVYTRVYQGIVNNDGEWILKTKGLKFVEQSKDFYIFKSIRKYKVYNRQGQLLKQFSQKRKVSLTDSGYSIKVASKKFAKFYGTDLNLIAKKSFSKSAELREDTVFVLRSRKLALYNLEKKKIANLNHYGGSRVTSSKYWRIEKKGNKVNIYNFPSYQWLYPGHFPKDSTKIILDYPKDASGQLSLLRYKLEFSVKNNCYFYYYKNSSQSYYLMYDQYGQQKTKQGFSYIKHWKGDLYIARTNTANGLKYGVINSNGIWEIEPVYLSCEILNNNYLRVSVSNLLQIANSKGELISAKKYGVVERQNNLYLLKNGDDFEWWSPEKGWLHKI